MFDLKKALALPVLLSLITGAGAATKLVQNEGNFQLLVDGKPFFIKGAGGSASKQYLKDSGGNSFRTWGVGDETQAQLDEAQRLGLKVTLGIWIGHSDQGFNYSNPAAIKKQFETAKAAVMKYKDHPAVLAWAVGNEMENEKGSQGDNPVIWAAVNQIAAMIHKVDPNHPTMTVVAEVTPPKIEAINSIATAIDIVGINSYGGGPSLAKRYRDGGGTKPYVICEFGPAGTWEVPKNDWGACQEQTSTAKAASYRATYEKSVLAEKDKLCLGSYAFAWGNKQEATATWYGLFLPDGERLEPIDTLTELWGGKLSPNRCPQVQPLKVLTSNRVKPGETIKVQLDVKDPENDPLKIVWRLDKDYAMYGGAGEAQPIPPSYPEAIVKNGESTVELKMPEDKGGYWLYAIVHDNHNGAAVVDVPLYVDGGRDRAVTANKAKIPFAIFGEGAVGMPYVWSGWMGKTDAIEMDEKSADNPHSGDTCMKCGFKSPDNFGGIIWQSPANDWGQKPGGYDLSGAKKLTFWARGAEGGEKVKFVIGVIKDKQFNDSAHAEATETLTNDWKQYSINLTGKNLSTIKTGFGWVVGGQRQPVTFYLDDIRYE